MLGTQLTAAGSLTNSKPPTPPARVLGIVRLYSNSTIKMNQAALESRSIQLLIDKTSIPEAKMYVGGVRSSQDERLRRIPLLVEQLSLIGQLSPFLVSGSQEL